MRVVRVLVKPRPGAVQGDEDTVELLSMDLVFAVGSHSGKTPEGIMEVVLQDMVVTHLMEVAMITDVPGEWIGITFDVKNPGVVEVHDLAHDLTRDGTFLFRKQLVRELARLDPRVLDS